MFLSKQHLLAPLQSSEWNHHFHLKFLQFKPFKTGLNQFPVIAETKDIVRFSCCINKYYIFTHNIIHFWILCSSNSHENIKLISVQYQF